MLRRLMVVSAVAVVTGCPPAVECKGNSDCGAGSCVDGKCVAPAAGGSAGGMTAGGMGGGIATCMPACQVWQTCAGTTCVDGVLSVQAPMPGASVPVGGMFPLGATMTTASGATWTGAAIPVSVSAGSASASVASGASVMATAPATAQVVTVAFGWADAGAALLQTRQVEVVSCANATPQPFEECVPTADGGRNVSQDLIVTWLAPDAGAKTNQSPLSVSASVRKADGGTVLGPLAQSGAMLPVTGGAAATTLTASTPLRFSGSVDLSGAGEARTLTAGWMAPGPSASLNVVYDVTPPVVTVTIDSSRSSWKRDEATVVQVNASEAINPGVPSSLTIRGATLRGRTQCPGFACTTPSCECWNVNLALPVWPADGGLDGLIEVHGVAEDEAGNRATSDAGFIAVSRLRFASNFSLLNATVPLRQVAIGRAGEIVTGFGRRPAGQPRIIRFSLDGGSIWEREASSLDTAEVSAGPVIGRDRLWVGFFDGSARMFREAHLANGQAAFDRCYYSGLGVISGDLALGLAGGREVILGVSDGGLYAGEALRAGAEGAYYCPVTWLPDGGALSRTAVSTLVAHSAGTANEVFMANDEAPLLWKNSSTGTTWTNLGELVVPGPSKGLFVEASTGSRRVGGAVFATSAAGPLGTASALTSLSGFSGGATAVGDGGMFFGTSAGELVRIAVNAGAFSDGGIFPLGQGDLQAAPVLGSDGLLYAVSNTGVLLVRRQSDLSEVWRASLAGGINAVSHPALDVYRAPDGGKDCSMPLGTLLVMTRSGTTATLRSILVDSQGLDPTAPWPKYQRDNGNTGNLDSDLSAWTCP